MLERGRASWREDFPCKRRECKAKCQEVSMCGIVRGKKKEPWQHGGTEDALEDSCLQVLDPLICKLSIQVPYAHSVKPGSITPYWKHMPGASTAQT